MERDVQFVLVGSGEARFEDALRSAVKRYPGRIAAILRYDGQLANRIYAGADLYLSRRRQSHAGYPSSLRCTTGRSPLFTPPAGLRDTVLPTTRPLAMAAGFTFQSYNGDDFLQPSDRRWRCLPATAPAWDKLAQQDMREDFSWRVPAKAYRALFASLHEGWSAMRILYNSLETRYKTPFGTLFPRQDCRMRLAIPPAARPGRSPWSWSRRTARLRFLFRFPCSSGRGHMNGTAARSRLQISAYISTISASKPPMRPSASSSRGRTPIWKQAANGSSAA